MKVAFDVKGTLVGHHAVKVRRLLKYFQSEGAEITIWSNLYSYAHEIAEEFGVRAQLKYSAGDAVEENKDIFDFCVEDDRGQWYLAAHKIILVDTIPEDTDKFLKLLLDAPFREDLR